MFAQTDVTTSEDYNQYYDEDGQEQCEMNHTYNYWPALSKRARPEWMGEYGLTGVNDVDALDTAMVELYGALNSNLPMLSAIGIRTCFDVASEVLEVDPALTFAEKLDALVETKRIREVDRERLETAVEAGNASAHRGWKPEPNDLATMMNILEHFVFDAFVQPNRRKQLDEDALKVKGITPPKPPRKKKPKAQATAVVTLPVSEHLEVQK